MFHPPFFEVSFSFNTSISNLFRCGASEGLLLTCLYPPNRRGSHLMLEGLPAPLNSGPGLQKSSGLVLQSLFWLSSFGTNESGSSFGTFVPIPAFVPPGPPSLHRLSSLILVGFYLPCDVQDRSPPSSCRSESRHHHNISNSSHQ